ncbi:EmrB/QacA subfamily drug resistance transporter [Thermosporothrix hazakensis]|jgi:EmrB/QacA subfamily drug resistance transporter|uniref:EmrB/QacA subfamily drug resistance transporter n=1 Tax=Thermosporothrix hazakensis TaxID=644383 RepID=A0A326UC20_THEHA|nr:DHA2 family efflux MFS transporter permease subunit [Thermosporothrix hazakensis]PZW26065.1 EmrB/QacA subfamily drug resistance transporter [Thermosporothrix hazakensis]GCE51324.1 MFS transporter [Thermosporothrix hazakensis]
METQKQCVPVQDSQMSACRLQGRGFVCVLVALLLTLLLEALDQSIVDTAMPQIVASLGGIEYYSWVVNGYLVAIATVIPVVGKLSDVFGRKWFLVSGVTLFLLGSLLAGLAQTIEQLIAARVIQGLGAGVGIALVVVVVADIFPPEKRGRWQAIFGSVYGCANLLGPTLGGWLTDHGSLLPSVVMPSTRWRWIFYINLPVGMLALVLLLIFLPVRFSHQEVRSSNAATVKQIDICGALLIMLATVCMLVGLSTSTHFTSGMILAALVCYGLFLFVERRAKDPVIPPRIFRNRIFTIASILNLLQGVILFNLTIYLPLFLQEVLKVSATTSGALLTPMLVSSNLASLLAGFAAKGLKGYRRIVIGGALAMSIATFLLAQFVFTASLFSLLSIMVLAGLGLGVFFSMAPLAAQNALSPSQLGVGMSVMRYLGQLGPTLGVALVGMVVKSRLSVSLPVALQGGFQVLFAISLLVLVLAVFLREKS